MADIKSLKRQIGAMPVEARTGKHLRPGELMSCPFPEHADSTASFGPYEDDGLKWKCLGCGWQGDALDFVAKYDNVSLAEAINRFAGSQNKTETQPYAPIVPPSEWSWNVERLAKASVALQESKAAIDFLAGRGIPPEEAQALSFGLVAGYTSADGIEHPARIVIPTFVDGELAAVKLRAFGKFEQSQKWRKQRRDDKTYWLFNRDAAFLADDLYVVESELDAAMLSALGFAAISVDSSGHKLTPKDTALLKDVKRVIFALDSDVAGQECSKRLEMALPESKRLRIVPQGFKDLGELYAKAPDEFASRLAKLVRYAETTRKNFVWDDLYLENEIMEHDGPELIYVVDKLIPLQRITMLAGPEKSCKSLLAFYLGKCVVNGKKVFDNFKVKKIPCLYLDAEDGILGQYIGWMSRIGTEEVRFRTLMTGIPALDDPYLLAVCSENSPLLIVDSLHKFVGNGNGTNVNTWRSSDMEPVMEKLRQLCVAGATVILIHHSTKADPEQYRDSSVIGAGVDFLFAVVGEEPANGVKRVRMVGKPSRGAQPPTLSLIAFPALIDLGKFTSEENPPKTDVDRVVEFVQGAELAGPVNKTTVRKGLRGMESSRKDKALAEALEQGLLARNSDGNFTVPQGAACSEQFFNVPQERHHSGTKAQLEPF